MEKIVVKGINELKGEVNISSAKNSILPIIAATILCPECIVIDNTPLLEDVEVILAFEFKDTNKEYVVYTKNEKDENENITVYVSNIDHSGEEPKLLGVESEEEWNRIKDVLRELSKAE